MIVTGWLTVCLPARSQAVTNQFPGDGWISNRVKFPGFVPGNSIRFTGFEQVHAEVLAGRLRVVWPGAPTNLISATVWASADLPGHWLARDWRRFDMRFSGTDADVLVPVEDLELPLVYFIQAMGPTATNASLMRSVLPDIAGLELPTRVFWSYLDGFEEKADGWRIVSPTNGVLTTTGLARTGHHALAVTCPEGATTVSIGTTRARGRHFLRREVEGVSVWVRTVNGDGHARFSVVANAFSTNETRAVFPTNFPISATWKKVELLKSGLGRLALTDVDFILIELHSTQPAEFLVDDFELISR
ncbi:MAG: hypothetical protein H7X97_07485 [Opitutaceae bacterium]|nr:hypothetical protein [Verrucomicrobiales bacterium]